MSESIDDSDELLDACRAISDLEAYLRKEWPSIFTVGDYPAGVKIDTVRDYLHDRLD